MNFQTPPRTLNVLQPDNLVFLDIETTGLRSSLGAKICEIAMVKVSGGFEETFETLVNPLMPMPEECFKVHAISDCMLKTAPAFKDISNDIFNFIGSSTVICHNASFDLSFVSAELKGAGFECGNIPYLDTLKIARQYFSFESNALGAIANAIGHEAGIAHRAMADVLTTKAVSKYLFTNLYRKGVDSLEINYFQG
ncbi:MAG: 3'-5' exonuclease [Elusimicrobia bacterium]|nr:3'-5' exonuclease [Elusimicrobiota bacterium]